MPKPDEAHRLTEKELAALEKRIANVKRIRETFPFVPGLPEAPSDMQSFTFQEANNLEKILVQVESMFQWMDKSYLMAGEAMCGEF